MKLFTFQKTITRKTDFNLYFGALNFLIINITLIKAGFKQISELWAGLNTRYRYRARPFLRTGHKTFRTFTTFTTIPVIACLESRERLVSCSRKRALFGNGNVLLFYLFILNTVIIIIHILK
jgi:hypothetical protein